MKRLWFVTSLIVLFSLLLTACGVAAPGAAPAADGGDSGEVQDFVTWYQYDQNNEDPASDERVGNEYLRPRFHSLMSLLLESGIG